MTMQAGWRIQQVTAIEFADFFHVTGKKEKADPLARFIKAPVPFERIFLFAYDSEGVKPLARLCGARSFANEVAVGFFSGERAAFIELNGRIESWAKDKGTVSLLGPMVYNTWFPYRARLFNEEVLHTGNVEFTWEPSQPREHEFVWEEAGYRRIEDYTTRAFSDLAGFHARIRPDLTAALDLGFSIQSFATCISDSVQRTIFLDELFSLTMDSFKQALFFQPIPREQFHQLYLAGFSELKDLSAAFILRDALQKPAAFSFAFRDNDFLVFKTVAVGTQFRGKKLANAVMAASSEAGLSQGLDKMVHALMRRGNESEHFGGKSELIFEHRYGLFAKNLESR